MTEILTHPEEKILLNIRRHPIIFLFLGIYIFFLILVSIIVLGFGEIFTKILGEKIFWLLIGAFWIIFSAIIFIIWSNSELDFLIVTNKKIIALKQISFLNREQIEIDFNKIQEIKSRIAGILPTIFNYGEITIQTASGNQNIKFQYIRNPNEKIKQINTIIQENQKSLL